MKILIFTTLLLASLGNEAQCRPPDNVDASATKKYTLTALPYALDALEPAISRRTMELHYGRHLPTYVDNLNRLIEGTALEGEELESVVLMAEGPLLDNAGQTLNHELYFLQFSPNGGGEPTGELRQAMMHRWGSVENFKTAMEEAGRTLFGSGWVWLAADRGGNLYILQEANGLNPVRRELRPLLGFDVWEHAYYLDYENRRSDHLKALWQIVNWPVVERRYENN
ncbi:MAG: superoxide dismutase [Alistipes sp.]|nr:superoxide dismutase [Alistipes sp.]